MKINPFGKLLAHCDGEIRFFKRVLKDNPTNEVAKGHLIANEYLRKKVEEIQSYGS